MAITTYAELKAAVANWLARDGDSSITDNAADFIALFEANINRVLRVRQMETTTTLTPSSGTATLPTDYLEWRRLVSNGSPPVVLEYTNPDYLYSAYPETSAGIPYVFTIEGSALVTRPVSDSTLTLSYYQKIPTLSETNMSNWLLAAYPDIYLFGSLVEANAFTKSPDAAQMWAQRVSAIVDNIKTLDAASRAPSAIRPSGATP